MIDIAEPKHEVEFVISADGTTVWLNVDGVCAARVCRIHAGLVTIRDESKTVDFDPPDPPQDF